MPTIFIDNEPYNVADGGKSLLEVCLTLGFDIPYFCWHPAMHSIGACRQCAVKQFQDENDTRGRLVMSCETPIKDGMRISIDDPEAVEFRRSITEWLMVNHPHDCPICDEGGECHLQDMTVMTGHSYRRARFPKRTHRNQDMGPFVAHEMNRCIQCYRCVRFYNDYAGGRDFGVFGWHDNVYFGRHVDGVLESEFSGNLVEVCPTGVFTDKTHGRHFVRKWDLQTAPSICVHCGLGCNTIPGERYGMLRRIRNRYNGEVNGYFLCDRGRYGYEFVNSPQRISTPQLQSENGLQPAYREEDTKEESPSTRFAARRSLALPWTSDQEVIAHVAKALKPGKVIGIGSPRASLEANFALRTLVGPENFYSGVSRHQYRLIQQITEILQEGRARTPSQQEVARADAVFILGEDLHNVAPMLAFAVRQAALEAPKEALEPELHIPSFCDYPVREAIQQARSPIFIATPCETKLDGEAALVYRGAPDDIARFGFAVANALDPASPPIRDSKSQCSEELSTLARQVADALKAANRPLIISGCSCGSLAVVQAAANIALALRRVNVNGDLCFTLPECNSLGLAIMKGGSIEDALEALHNKSAVTVIILENDLYHQLDGVTADAIFDNANEIVVLDHLETATTRRATAILPAATFAESNGTFVSSEGRAQRYYQVFVPENEARESWRWLDDIMVAAGKTHTWLTCDDILAALARELPVFNGVTQIAPPADFRIVGQKIARQSHRYSGRTAMTTNVAVQEPPPTPDPDTPFTFSMDGYQGEPPSPLIPRFWSPGWNSVQSVNKFQSEVGGSLRVGDPGRRLIEPPAEGTLDYFTDIPDAFTPRDDEWLILPAYHIFGSEPLSMKSPVIAELAPKPYLALNQQDAEALGVNEGQQIALAVGEHVLGLALHLAAELPRGTAVVPSGLPEMPGMVLPAWGKILPVSPGSEEAQQ